MIKSVIFDMDGLMFDTEKLAIEAWCCVFEKMGVENVYSVAIKTLGLNLENTKTVFLDSYGKHFDFDAAEKLRVEYVLRYVNEYGIPVKPGLYELLDFLKMNGYSIAVATSTYREKAMHYLVKAEVAEFFDAFVCGDMIEKGKPAPDIYIKAGELLCTHPSCCMALEDSPFGIMSAFSAGMKPVMIPDLVQADDEINKMLYASVRSLSDVIELLSTV